MRFAILLVALALVAAVFSDAAVVRRKRQGQLDGELGDLTRELTSKTGELEGDLRLRRRKRQGQSDGVQDQLNGVLGYILSELTFITGVLEGDERQLRR